MLSPKLAAKAADRIAELEAKVARLEQDLMECAEYLGVRPLYYNGAHQAVLNQTNVPIDWFKTDAECQQWCLATNKRFGTENRTPIGNHIDDELGALKERAEIAEAENAKLRKAGRAAANFCFNIGRGHSVGDYERDSARVAAKTWDGALAGTTETKRHD